MTTATKKSKQKKAINVLNVAFVWDMSGSMRTVYDATCKGTLDYLLDLQNEETKLAKKSKNGGPFTRLSLTAFDTRFETWVVNQPIADVNVEGLVSQYMPRGGTALYDAIANTIAETDAVMKEEKREDEKVLVIIMTDGGENSSREYALGANGRRRLMELVEAYQAKGNWTFVYLGANVDSYAEASAIGIAAGNAASYDSTADSILRASSALGSVTSSRRGGASGQTVNAFADAGVTDDYRDPERALTEHEKRFANSSDASKESRSA